MWIAAKQIPHDTAAFTILCLGIATLHMTVPSEGMGSLPKTSSLRDRKTRVVRKRSSGKGFEKASAMDSLQSHSPRAGRYQGSGLHCPLLDLWDPLDIPSKKGTTRLAHTQVGLPRLPRKASSRHGCSKQESEKNQLSEGGVPSFETVQLTKSWFKEH